MSSATFSSRDTVNGSSWKGVAQVARDGSTGASVTGSIASREAARAIWAARAAVRSISSGVARAVAANPQYPSTRTRIPRPSDRDRSMPSISWFLTVSDSASSETNRASAYPAPAFRAASTACWTTSSTSNLPCINRGEKIASLPGGSDSGQRDPCRGATIVWRGNGRPWDTSAFVREGGAVDDQGTHDEGTLHAAWPPAPTEPMPPPPPSGGGAGQ